jgi:hypothetical protein
MDRTKGKEKLTEKSTRDGERECKAQRRIRTEWGRGRIEELIATNFLKLIKDFLPQVQRTKSVYDKEVKYKSTRLGTL